MTRLVGATHRLAEGGFSATSKTASVRRNESDCLSSDGPENLRKELCLLECKLRQLPHSEGCLLNAHREGPANRSTGACRGGANGRLVRGAIIALCFVGGVIYAVKRPTLGLALAQAGCTYVAVALRIAFLYPPSWEALLWLLVFGTLFFVLWMTPVGIISSYLQGRASRANA